MLGEVQYGGRVTDDLDKTLLNTFARVWFGDHMFSDKFCFYKGYGIPKGKTVDEYLQHIEQLPMVDTPQVITTSYLNKIHILDLPQARNFCLPTFCSNLSIT